MPFVGHDEIRLAQLVLAQQANLWQICQAMLAA
jgi:hypothetical protein